MNLIFFYILNIFVYFVSLKIFFVIFKLNYRFPFRHADLSAFTFNTVVFVSFSYLQYDISTAIATFFINLNSLENF